MARPSSVRTLTTSVSVRISAPNCCAARASARGRLPMPPRTKPAVRSAPLDAPMLVVQEVIAGALLARSGEAAQHAAGSQTRFEQIALEPFV